MSITELIVKVQNLSVEKQAEVFNFVKNLESISSVPTLNARRVATH
jgi:hypothetical protein